MYTVTTHYGFYRLLYVYICDRCKQSLIKCRCKHLDDVFKKDSLYLYENCRLCANHFENSQFRNEKRNGLKRTAVPTLFAVPHPPKTLDPLRPCR